MLLTLTGHSDTVYAAAWSSDSLLLASGGKDDSVAIWEISTGRKQRVRKLDSWANTLAWAPSSLLACGCEDGSIDVLDGRTGENIRTLIGHSGNVNCVAWSPDSSMLASASGDSTIRIWAVASGKTVRILQGHTSWAFTLVWSGIRNSIISGSWDGTIREWSPTTGTAIRVLGGQTSKISSVSLSCDGRLLASKSYDDTVQIWDADTGELVATIPERRSDRHSPSIAFHPTLPLLATLGDGDTILRIWHFDTPSLLQKPQTVTRHYRNAKIALVGDSGVGKSGLSVVLTANSFRPTDSTHGRNILTLESSDVPIDAIQHERREIFLWDTAGQPGYRLVHYFHLSDASVALVVFDGRSEVDPFAGVRYWRRSLRHTGAGGAVPAIKVFLVAARIDRGGVGVSQKRIDNLIRELAFDGYFETSAKEGWGISELADAIRGAIDWSTLPQVSSTELFYAVKDFVLRKHERGSFLSTASALFQDFPEDNHQQVERSQFDLCIGFLENQRLVRRLSFGGLVVLAPEILDGYAGAIINAAKEEPDGLGFIPEHDLVSGRFKMPESERLTDADDERLLLIATLEELLRHEIAFKEVTDLGVYVVFPSQFTRDAPDAPDSSKAGTVFAFEGALPTIYSTLAVRLARSRFFTNREMWMRAAIFDAAAGGVCGIQIREIEEGKGELSVWFDITVAETTKYEFEQYVNTHLIRRAIPGSVRRWTVFACHVCGTPFTNEVVNRRRAGGHTTISCPVCDATGISLLETEERLHLSVRSTVARMDSAADYRRELDAASTVLMGKVQSDDFDVFMCHNSIDKPAVIEIAERLKQHGVLPWLDIWNIAPGTSWQRSLEAQIRNVKSAAVFVGKDGFGPWQQEEVEALLNEFVATGRPVIPVLLVEAPSAINLPPFLKNRNWVDFRKYNPDPLRQLLWGITGDRKHLGQAPA